MMRAFSRGVAAAALAVAGSSYAAAGPVVVPVTAASVIDVGVTLRVTSSALGEERIVNVVLPASYRSHPRQRYPVLYLIDGGVEQDLLHIAGLVRLGSMWGRSGEAIVVGVETRDRRKELVGPTSDPELLTRYPTAGSAAKFREFLKREVKPLIERTYRTDGDDAVMGESLAGLFVVDTYLTEPSLFGRYAAVDPSLWWDKEALSKSAARKLDGRQRRHPLLVAIAAEQSKADGAYRRLAASLATAGLDACLVQRPDQSHATIYQQIAPQVLQFLSPPTRPAPAEYGFTPPCMSRPKAAGDPARATDRSSEALRGAGLPLGNDHRHPASRHSG